MFLEKILDHKKKEVVALKKQAPLEELVLKCKNKTFHGPSFAKAVSRDANSQVKLIAEIKKSSPSKGLLRKDFDPLAIAKIYESSGVQAISILTDQEFFEGHLNYLKQVSHEVSIPVLRKDFIIDEYQVYEAKINGAKGILLIVAALEKIVLKELIKRSGEIGLDALVEVHDEKELETALECGASLIGINNRNLHTFAVDIKTSERLIPRISKDKIIVVESGISTHDDVLRIAETKADAILVGETFMKAINIEQKIKELMG
jgi:indole-3-glycerol phosphate synthase